MAVDLLAQPSSAHSTNTTLGIVIAVIGVIILLGGAIYHIRMDGRPKSPSAPAQTASSQIPIDSGCDTPDERKNPDNPYTDQIREP